MVLLDAGYGNDSQACVRALRNWDWPMCRHSAANLGMEAKRAAGPDAQEGRRDAPNTTSVKDLALPCVPRAWPHDRMGEGTNEWLSSRLLGCAFTWHQAMNVPENRARSWLLIECPRARMRRPSTGSRPCRVHHVRDLVDAAKLRWRIERDYEELKQEVGLGHYEVARVALASTIMAPCASQPTDSLISERETIPPQDRVPPRCSRNLPYRTVTDPRIPLAA